MTFITDFADQAVILPLAVAVAIALLVQGWWRGAAVWTLAVCTTFTAMLALKIVFLACAHGFVDIRTPSGHVAAATVVAGGLAGLLLRRRATVVPLAVLAALVIGVSRLLSGAHSVAEVVVGAMVGLVGAVGLHWLAGPPPPRFDARRIALIAVLVMVLFHGLHLPAEAEIRANAWRFAQVFGVCQADQARP